MKKHIGLIGLGTMGINLANNISAKHDKLFIYNRSEGPLNSIKSDIFKTTDLKKFVEKMEEGLILVLVPEKVVRVILNSLRNIIKDLKLENKFIVADAGNSNFLVSIENKIISTDTFFYACIGTSGGAAGALNGPAMMVGCDLQYKEYVLDLLSIFTPNATYTGEYFMAHFIKMVHNGIEYSKMGALGEFTNLIFNSTKSFEKTIKIFESLNICVDSFLVNCLLKVLKKKENGENVLLSISNKMGQKGTGKWCIIESMKLSVNTQTIGASVYERIGSVDTGEYGAEEVSPAASFVLGKKEEEIILALIFLFYAAYYEGLCLLEAQCKKDNLDFSSDLYKQAWKKNCIIESKILKDLKSYKSMPDFLTFFHENYQISMNLEISKEDLLKDVRKSFNELYPLFCGEPSTVFHAGMAYLTNLGPSNVVGRSIQGIRDVFGQHGVDYKGENRNFDW